MKDYRHSRLIYERMAGIAGRSSTRSKAPGQMFPEACGPLYVSGGHQATLFDADGHSYIDMLCALGAMSLGYWPDFGGHVYSLPHVAEADAAESVLQILAPWATQARFVRTGSEAMTAAVMLARKATGRRQVLVARGSYHGWHPWTSQRGEAETDGEHTFQYEYGLVPTESLPPVAAIIVEPARWQETSPGYLKRLQAAAHAQGALFIVDEMIYGGRWAIGGATELDGLAPDLACYGKAVANGAPVAVVVGNDVLRHHGHMVSGTYSGDALCCAALTETLATYDREPVIETLWARGRRLREGLRVALACTGWSARAAVDGAGAVHQRIRFIDDNVPSQPGVGRMFAAEMAERGVLWHPACVNVSYAHTEAQIDRVVEAAAASLTELTKLGFS